MKLLWLGYLVYSLGNCAMKLCIETGLSGLLINTVLGGHRLILSSGGHDVSAIIFKMICYYRFNFLLSQTSLNLL